MQKFIDQQRIKYNLKGLIISVNDKTYVSGNSMTTELVNPDMHFNIGGQGITVLTTLFLILVEQGYLRLSTKIGKYLPKVPNGDQITLWMLCNMTFGLPDLPINPGDDVFRQWTSQELLEIVYQMNPIFEPGTKFLFSHLTAMLLLGTVLNTAMNCSLEFLLKTYIFEPLRLSETRYTLEQDIKSPILHAFANIRVKDYEESTFWNDSWTSYAACLQSTSKDLIKIARNLGSGQLLSQKYYRIQMSNSSNDDLEYYGMGCAIGGFGLDYLKSTKYPYPIIWTSQDIAGYAGIWAYIPSQKLAIQIQTNTYNGDGFSVNMILSNMIKSFGVEKIG